MTRRQKLGNMVTLVSLGVLTFMGAYALFDGTGAVVQVVGVVMLSASTIWAIAYSVWLLEDGSGA